MKNLVIYAAILLIPFVSFSQNENSKWFFGTHAAIDFMPTTPAVISHTTMNSSEGTASIADASGNLLFYTNGMTIWNKQMLVMSNGTGLLGHFSTAQSALIVRKPSSSVEYFVFTLDLQGGSNGLRYSVVDMSLASGLGAVTVKNVPITAPCTEQLTGTYHCNGYDVWVITHDFSSNQFFSYLVTSAGINTTAVVSAVGPVPPTYSVTNAAYGQGVIKISNTGEKLGLTFWNGNPNNEVALFDFNNNTGAVSNYVSLLKPSVNYYGCEFSPDGSKFYSSATQTSGVYQWNVCAGSPSLILASTSTVGLGSNGNLQLAPNGKIYLARYSQTLSVINNPNAAGLACNFSTMGIAVPNSTINVGLPAFVSGRSRPVPAITFSSTTQNGCESKSFNSTTATFQPGCGNTNSVAGINWDFGDPASGAANTSTLNSPSHVFSSTGTYTVKLIYTFACGTDTIQQIIPVTNGPSVTVSASHSTLCVGKTTTLTAQATGSTGPYSYAWTGGPPTGTFATSSATPGTINYVVQVTDQQGCQELLSIPVEYLPLPTLTAQGKTVCPGVKVTLTVTGATSYTWVPSNTTGSVLNIQTPSPTLYTVTGTATNGCMNTKTVQLSVTGCEDLKESTIGAVRIYPSVVADMLTIDTEKEMRIVIYDITGHMVRQADLPEGKTNLDLSTLSPGMYLISGKGLGTRKIIRSN